MRVCKIRPAGRWIRVGLAAITLALAAEARGSDGEWDWGFLASRQRDVDGRMRVRALGPLLEYSEGEDGSSLLAFRPLYAKERNPKASVRYQDFLWPVAHERRLGNDESWRLLLAFGHRFDVSLPRGRYRTWILPFYFQGRDAQGRFYCALFPLGGRISDILFQDRVDFALFPLWARTETGGGQIRTQSILWPIYSRTRGKGIDRFRVFPFYARNSHRGVFEKRAILWPIWTDVRYHYPQSSGYGYALFPLWAQMKLTDQETWMLFPPLIRRTRAETMNTFSIWPFFQWRQGQESRLSIWPLWSRTRRTGMDQSYLLWPIGRRERWDRGDTVWKSDSILPVFQMQSLAPREPGGPALERHVRVWPLLSYQRVGDASVLRIPDLWPTRSARPVERSWAPIWTLYEHRAQGDNRRTECLWGLYRNQTRGTNSHRVSLFPLVEWETDAPETGPVRRWSLLKGLLERSGSKSEVKYRMFYFIRWHVQRKDVKTP